MQAEFVGLIWLLSFLAVAAGIGIAMYWGYKSNQKRQAALLAYATQKGFSYIPKETLAGVDGSVPAMSTRKHQDDVIRGELHGLPLTAFQHVYVTGSGKSRQTHYVFVAQVDLPHTMPQMVIDSLVDESALSVLPISFDQSQRMDLEGDFYKYFSVYAPDRREADALVLLAPDVMQVVMEHGAKCDIEFINKHLYFYWPLRLKNTTQVDEALTTVDVLLREIGDKLKRFDRAAASRTHSDIHTSPVSGERLKTNIFSVRSLLILVPFLVLMSMTVLGPNTAAVTYVLLLAGWGTPLFLGGFVLLLIRKKARLRKELSQRYPKNPSDHNLGT